MSGACHASLAEYAAENKRLTAKLFAVLRRQTAPPLEVHPIVVAALGVLVGAILAFVGLRLLGKKAAGGR